ncbi:J domain-containing protein 1 [Escovopsis weberi]|uniref:J domain-containing protein 1 n=1 Tax=Escovopsis weberi TaxID=150374 RepID=A0A0M8MW96_ESCWE|nr:J domain-containing protein 1 [Escovopsis weberi]
MAYKAPALAATSSSLTFACGPRLASPPIRCLFRAVPSRPPTPSPHQRASRARRYATVRDAAGQSSSGEQLPPWPRGAHPSPYEILGMERHAEYNKRAYYRLAKLYHPDSHHSGSPSSSPSSPSHPDASIRLERYRLLVAAHELLNDPAKRRLYDTTGLGWAPGGPGAGPSLRDMDRSWRSRPGSAANNATWEDWERWHAAREGRAGPEPAYMSHGMFASMVVALCMVGWLAQLTRAESAGDQYMAWMAEQNARIGRGLAQDGIEAVGRTRGERVDHFLKDRENTLYGYEPARYERDEPQRERRA